MKNKSLLPTFRYVMGIDTAPSNSKDTNSAVVFNQTKDSVVLIYHQKDIKKFEAEVIKIAAYYSAIIIRE